MCSSVLFTLYYITYLKLSLFINREKDYDYCFLGHHTTSTSIFEQKKHTHRMTLMVFVRNGMW